MPTARRLAHSLGRLLALGLLGGSLLACSQGVGDRSAHTAPAQALAIAPVAERAPYEVTIRREDGSGADTFAHRGRFYVLGQAGERYVIHVSNPTDRRVEAVVTVDGLDVIDGEDGDLGKRGYIVPPHGDLEIDGFRTSSDQVATFRFSSVDGSYAGKKGKARNVGVIAVAIFAEQAAPEVIVDEREETWPTGRDRGGDPAVEGDAGPSKGVGLGGGVAAEAPGASRARRPAPDDGAADSVGGAMAPMPCCTPMPPPPPIVDKPAPRTGRLGLGTEFGESRYSATTFTRFVRASATPIAVAELRYNDAPGLTALGIGIAPPPDSGELMTRETADPFPTSRFATPPR
jgi:hypothetical protein